MTPEEFLNKIPEAIEKTAEQLRPTMQEAALTGKALLARRIQSTGFGRHYISRGYIRLRARRGFEIRFVNLTFTGAMFRGWKEPDTERDGLIVRGRIGGVDQETKNKLRWNKSRYPNFDRSSNDERTLISESLIKPRIKELIENNLFGT